MHIDEAKLKVGRLMFDPMREYGFTVTEHDPDRPWMVLASEHRPIKLPDGMDFFSWAREHWPAPR